MDYKNAFTCNTFPTRFEKEFHQRESQRCYNEVENIYRQEKRKNEYIEYADILERIRDKANEVLRISE